MRASDHAVTSARRRRSSTTTRPRALAVATRIGASPAHARFPPSAIVTSAPDTTKSRPSCAYTAPRPRVPGLEDDRALEAREGDDLDHLDRLVAQHPRRDSELQQGEVRSVAAGRAAQSATRVLGEDEPLHVRERAEPQREGQGSRLRIEAQLRP